MDFLKARSTILVFVLFGSRFKHICIKTIHHIGNLIQILKTIVVLILQKLAKLLSQKLKITVLLGPFGFKNVENLWFEMHEEWLPAAAPTPL